MFRDVLDQHGLHPVMEGLGKPIDQKELSSEKHKFIRDPDRRGRLRVFGLGIRIDDMVVSSGLIMNSGDENDRD
jgi:putative Mn2+ efflux pump MntP